MLAAAVLCGLTLTTSCTKEEVSFLSNKALEIFAESIGTKTTVNGTTVKWVLGDKMWVNGEEGTVSQNGNHWYVDGSFSTNCDFNMFYPATLATATDAENQNDATATVVFPSHYASSFDDEGNQVIALPMAARSESSATGATLKHLSAGINVDVTNGAGFLLLVDSVCVTSSSINLCGQSQITLSTNDVPTINAFGNGEKSVTVYFNTPVAIAANGSKSIQVPVIPNASSMGDITIKVFTHSTKDSYNIHYLTFSKQKSNTPGLERNAVAALPVNMATSGSDINSRILGAFSVSSTKKVYFSSGNLQYNSSETYPWRFAPNQYDRMGAWNTSTWVDLFGWGTWTGNEPNPYFTIEDDAKYFWNAADFVKESELADASQRGFDWYTMSKSEYEYLLVNRPYTYRYAKAVVHNIEGLLIFPDEFTLPTGIAIKSLNAPKENNFGVNTISDDNWEALEAAGCVFLPAAGNRIGTTVNELGFMGGYHSSTGQNSKGNGKNDYKLRFADLKNGSGNNNVYPSKAGGTRFGNSVRLVRKAN